MNDRNKLLLGTWVVTAFEAGTAPMVFGPGAPAFNAAYGLAIGFGFYALFGAFVFTSETNQGGAVSE